MASVKLLSVEHVSPACVKLIFSGTLRNDDILRLTNSYWVPSYTISAVHVPESQAAEYNSLDPNPNGGAPRAVYLLLTSVASGGPFSVGLSAYGLANIVDYDGNNLSGSALKTLTFQDQHDVEFWSGSGRRVSETFTELRKVGKITLSSSQPLNTSMAQMIGKLNDLMSGGFTGALGNSISGPDEPEHVTTFSPAGFAAAKLTVPGIGDTIEFNDNYIPYHVDKLWGVSDGDNTVFRASIQYHPFECVVIAVRGSTGYADNGLVEATRWYAPNNGTDRLIAFIDPPPAGATLLAVYVPRKSLLRIGKEIIAYEESDIEARTAVIYGRAQLMSELVAHDANDQIEDVWATSFVGRAEYSLLAFGASGRALAYLGLDRGSSRSDNPYLSDTELRRMIFHTSFNMRGVIETVREAFRYIYPDLWPYVVINEDPRWPGCLVVWYHNYEQIGDMSWFTSPPIEPWETWLDHLAQTDGLADTLIYETYIRDSGTDNAFYGDFLLEDSNDNPPGYAYPVVISGPVVSLLGEVAPTIPPPFVSGGTIDTTYRSYLVRPEGLDKALPAGCGVLLLDVTLL